MTWPLEFISGLLAVILIPLLVVGCLIFFSRALLDTIGVWPYARDRDRKPDRRR